MEDYNPYQTGSQNLLPFLNASIGVLLAVCLLLIFLSFGNFGTIHMELPADTTITLNGHTLGYNSVVKLRPGTYQITVTSPRTNPWDGTAHINLFRTTDFSPVLSRRSADAIASSTMGAIPGGAQAPQLEKTQWFENNTWLVGRLTGTSITVAFTYSLQSKQWSVGYYTGGVNSYPDNTATLPANVATYIGQIGK